jgi:drug/metabolite transporter (DMT)-like permease
MRNNLSDNMRGAFLMSACMAAFGINDALIKASSADFSLFQAIFIRSVITTFFLFIYAWRQRAFASSLAFKDKLMIVVRIIGEICGAFMFLHAIFNMPLANATAILQSMPLAVTLAGAIFLNEPVGWRRYVAVIIGFIGVMIIVRPGTEGFNSYSFYALGAVACLVVRDLTTRQLSPSVPSSLVSFLTSAGILLASGAMLPFSKWHEVTQGGLLTVAAAAGFLIFGYVLNVSSMRIGEIAFVSPFRYTILLWSIVLGAIVFGDIPDGWTTAGSVIVVLTGIYTFYREQRAKRAETMSKS